MASADGQGATVRLFVVALVAALVAVFGVAVPSAAALSPTAGSLTYTYDSRHGTPLRLRTATPQWPPGSRVLDAAYDADGNQPRNMSVHPAGPTTTYTTPAVFAHGAAATDATQERAHGDGAARLSLAPSGIAANAGVRLADSGVVNPATIRFSHNSISGTFRGGGGVKDLAAELRNGTVNPGDIPAIRLVERNGNYFTLDNRRRAAFQEAGVDIPYRMASPSEIASQGWKFTTTDDGTSILIRGGG
jgi:hypothetical protein